MKALPAYSIHLTLFCSSKLYCALDESSPLVDGKALNDNPSPSWPCFREFEAESGMYVYPFESMNGADDVNAAWKADTSGFAPSRPSERTVAAGEESSVSLDGKEMEKHSLDLPVDEDDGR